LLLLLVLLLLMLGSDAVGLVLMRGGRDG